jgi:hypothetical protein
MMERKIPKVVWKVRYEHLLEDNGALQDQDLEVERLLEKLEIDYMSGKLDLINKFLIDLIGRS